MTKRVPAKEPAEDYLGWRTIWKSDRVAPMLIIEGPLDGHDEWRLGLWYMAVEERLVLAQVKIFPAGDRHLFIDGPYARRRDGYQDPSLAVGMWSETPEALKGITGGGITSRLLHSVKLGDLGKDVRRALSASRELVISDDSSTVGDVWASVIAEQTALPRNAGRNDLFYASWAARYLSCCEEDPRRPHKLMADRYGISATESQYLIKQARIRHIIGVKSQGASGGQWTAKGERLRDELRKRAAR